MSNPAGAGGQPADELQFDQVEYATQAPAASCKLCSQPLQDTYYEINGQAVCPACRQRCQQALASGSAFGRFVRATLYGSLAGLVGAALYYGVREVTHFEFAIIRMQQHPVNPVENARIGLAGPLWGLGAAVASLGVYLISQGPSWLAIARVGAWINLFNLLPIWQLDGGRGFSSLTKSQRGLAVAAIAVAWFLTAEGLLLLLLIAGGFQTLSGAASDRPDRVGLVQYVGLVAILSAMCLLPVPVER